MEVQINYWAVIVAAVVNMGLGALWYSPLLFGKIWMNLAGVTEEDIQSASRQMPRTYALMFLAALVMAYVLAHMVDYSQASGIVQGFSTGFWLWLGFVATVSLQGKIFENRPWKLWVLNNGYNLAALMIMAAILSVWR